MSEQQRQQDALDEARQRVDARVARIEAELDDLTRARRSESDDDEHDPEGVPLSAEWSRLMGLRDTARAEATQVVDALRRLEAGTYGVCVTCGKQIPVERLEVRPYADRCVPCAS
jgi:DnaK suppressor protein